MKLAWSIHFMLRYIDDVLSLNNKFGDHVTRNCHIQFEKRTL